MSETFIASRNNTDFDTVLNESQKLTAPVLQAHESPSLSEFNEFVTPVNNMAIGGDGRFTYTSHVLTPYEREHWWIPMDHCYARPWNWRPESTFLRPTKTLFMPKPQPVKRKSANPLAPSQDNEELIDVETENDEPTCIYDKTRAKHVMEECERHAALARIDDGNENWEENISRANWTPTQNRLFNGMVNILNSDRLARLAYANSHNEPVCRRITVDKSVDRVRRLMTTVSWDMKFTQWLHQLLIDNLSTQYLASYLDILQTLRSKLPTFVDKLMGSATSSRLSLLSFENLFNLLKRPWDPVALNLMQDKPKKLPGNPVLILMSSSPTQSKRMLKWASLLSNLATVVQIPPSYGGTPSHKVGMINCVDQMFVVTRNKIQDIKLDYPGRNVVLVGFGFGATLALQVAQTEQVLCVVCLGFSLQTAEGKRGEPDDNLLELQCPVLFVVGQCSNTSLQEEMEDLRERMRVETGLIIVGSADDNLRVNKKKKKSEGITQSVVDRCIADEIGEFISGLILSPYPPQIRQSPTNLTIDAASAKKIKTERKRYNSNTSSLDSEPPSPTPRISRPGQNNSPPHLGRPPGSKSKTKWATQGTTLSPSSSPPPLQIINTPDTSSNDSTLTDKVSLNSDGAPIKKIKTLKPTVPSEKFTTSSNQHASPSKNQPAKSMGFQNRSLSSLLQSDIPMRKPTSSGIKVLENVKITGGINTKFFANAGKMVDMSKISVINAKSTSGNSIVLLPDGKIKNLTPGMKNVGGRYITSKKQLIGNKPPKPVKKMSYVSQSCPLQSSSLPPPTNLTTQDIMDLPIIFADDNQILENTLAQPEVRPVQQIATPQQSAKIISSNTGNKFMLVNKQSNFVISPSSISKSANISHNTKTTPKFTKIILSSKKTANDDSKSANIVTKICNLSSEISVKKVPEANSASESPVEILDLENEIVTNTLYKPTPGDSEASKITIITTKPDESDETVEPRTENIDIDEFAGSLKRSASQAEITDSSDNKLLKLNNE